jgi:hypothetical protein
MIEIFIASLANVCMYLVFGHEFNKYCFGKTILNKQSYSEKSLFGVLLVAFFGLLLNFIIPLNKEVGTLFVIITFILITKFIYLEKKKNKLFIFLFITSITTFFLITLANVNRPDAGLYHLPFTSLINESKIIIGSVNIHFRFGHISILQYLSAINNNLIFSTASITIPAAAIFSVFIYYTINKINFFLKNHKNSLSLMVFLITIFSLYSFNRYSNYGNDVIVHIYFFTLIIFLLDINSFIKIDKNLFYKIAYLSIFLFSLKTFMAVIFFIPILIFFYLKIKLELIRNRNFIISIIFILSWIINNILVSACAIYPLNFTCLKDLKYYDQDVTLETKSMSEAWAKGWSDQKGSIITNYEEYNSKFNWFETWTNKHLKKIIEKFLPFLIFTFLIWVFLISKKYFLKEKIDKKTYENQKNIWIIFLISSVFLVLWFLKFPLYRYGQSFILTLYAVIYTLLIGKFINLNNKSFFKKFYKIVTIIIVIIFFGKNILRITNNYGYVYNDYPWPKIYTLDQKELNKEQLFKEIIKNDQRIYYYSSQVMCMYSRSPCSHYNLKNLNKDKIFSYHMYWKDKK